MKRELVCYKCSLLLKNIFPKNEPYPGEYIKLIDGKAKFQHTCDFCGTTIKQKGKCTAFSTWSARHDGVAYIPWESTFLEVKK